MLVYGADFVRRESSNGKHDRVGEITGDCRPRAGATEARLNAKTVVGRTSHQLTQERVTNQLRNSVHCFDDLHITSIWYTTGTIRRLNAIDCMWRKRRVWTR